jgi:Domain of unknown function (DUF6268)
MKQTSVGLAVALFLLVPATGLAQQTAPPAVSPPAPAAPGSDTGVLPRSPVSTPQAAGDADANGPGSPGTTPLLAPDALPPAGSGSDQALPAWPPAARAPTAEPLTGSVSTTDYSRGMSAMGMEALALGEGMAPVPRVGYAATWYPDETAGGQGHFEMVRQDFHFSTPLFRGDHDVVSFSAGVRSEILDTDALVPVLNFRFPEDLWNVNFGIGYFHEFANGWTAGLNVHGGSASDDPFENINQVTVGVMGSLRIPVRERDAWIFTLSYSNNTDFANGIPIPGVAYLWRPNDSFGALIGIPFAHIWYRPVDKVTIDLSYRFLYTVQGRVTYHFLPRWRLYGGYSMGNESYFLSEATSQDDNRLFYSEQRVYAGLAWALARQLSVDLTSGLAFDRYYSEGRNFTENSSLKLPIGAGPFVTLAVQWRF